MVAAEVEAVGGDVMSGRRRHERVRTALGRPLWMTATQQAFQDGGDHPADGGRDLLATMCWDEGGPGTRRAR